jgi:hypothetical protein
VVAPGPLPWRGPPAAGMPCHRRRRLRLPPPLCSRRPACVCPMAGRAARGFALLTSAREILASASIFN